MANTRNLQVFAVTTNSVTVGGIATLSLIPSATFTETDPHGDAGGVECVDVESYAVAAALMCKDITKVNAILAGTVGNTVYSMRQSASATKWTTCTVTGILWNGATIVLPAKGEGTLSLTGVKRFADGEDISDLVVVDDTIVVEPTAIVPDRYYRPYTVQFTPDGGAAIDLKHVEDITLSLTAPPMASMNDVDGVPEAVDLVGWRALDVSITFEDGAESSDKDIAQDVAVAGDGILTASLRALGADAAGSLTVRNLKLVEPPHEHGAGYSRVRLVGKASWRGWPGDVDTTYKMNAVTKLFEIAAG